jgi:hypothetical protein
VEAKAEEDGAKVGPKECSAKINNNNTTNNTTGHKESPTHGSKKNYILVGYDTKKYAVGIKDS